LTPEQFTTVVLLLQERGAIVAGHGWKTSLAKKLGVTRTSIDNFQREGTRQLQTDYALAALLAGVSALSPSGI